MTKSQIKELLYREFSLIFTAERQFKLKKSEGFVRLIPGGRQTIVFPLYDYNPDFDFSIVAAIRLESVEEIRNRFTGSPAKYHNITVTATAQLERFVDDRPARFRIRTEDDVIAVVKRIKPKMTNTMLTFLDQHQDIVSLDKFLNLENGDISAHPYRGMTAITLAKLAKNPQFDLLVEKYREEMKLFIEGERMKFENLVKHLKSL